MMDSIKIFGIYSPVLMLLGNVFIAGALVLVVMRCWAAPCRLVPCWHW